MKRSPVGHESFLGKTYSGAIACTPPDSVVKSLCCSVAGCASDWQCRVDSRLQALKSTDAEFKSALKCYRSGAKSLMPGCLSAIHPVTFTLTPASSRQLA